MRLPHSSVPSRRYIFRAERASRRSQPTPPSYFPCRTINTQRSTFITVVSLVFPEEEHQQVATITTTIRAADYFISADRVGEVSSLLFTFRFEPHVLQVCSPSGYLLLYEELNYIFLNAAPDPSLSAQFTQQDPTQTDPTIAHFSQQGWQANQGMRDFTLP